MIISVFISYAVSSKVVILFIYIVSTYLLTSYTRRRSNTHGCISISTLEHGNALAASIVSLFVHATFLNLQSNNLFPH